MLVHQNIEQIPVFRNAVLTVGSFDGVHIGHQAILNQLVQTAKEIDGESIVLTFSPHPRHFLEGKSIELLHSLAEKESCLKKMGVDHLVIIAFDDTFATQSPTDYIHHFLIKRFNPKAIILGFDHRFGKGGKGNIDLLRKQASGIDIIEIPANTVNNIKISSTKIRRALKNGHVKLAQTYLCAPFSIMGTVVHGDKLGHRLGFPTANIKIDNPDKLLPKEGVYAVFVNVQNKDYKGMLHIGNRPTVDGHNLRIEVNIFDFNQDIYGQSISVRLFDFIRENQKFQDKTALIEQLKKDQQTSLQLLNNQQFNVSKTAVVILNYNGTKHLNKYLPTVTAHTPPEIDIYVADNGSTDDSLAFLQQYQKQHPQIKLIKLSQNYGFAGGYNEALKEVKSDIYILLNSDVRVTENWTTPLTKAMEDPDLSVCQPKILSDLDPTKFEYAGASGGYIDFLGYPFCRGRIFGSMEEDLGQYNDEVEIFWATGAAMVIRSKLFWDFKGFDATFFAHNEEIDMCWQIKRAGYKIKAIPSSTVYHLGGGTLSYNTPNKVYLNFRNNLKMLVKNDRLSTLAWKLPLRLVLDGLAGGLFLYQGHFSLIGSIIRAHFAFYASIPKLIKKRKEIKKILTSLPNKPIKKPKGIFPHSVVWRFYAQGKDTFSKLEKPN